MCMNWPNYDQCGFYEGIELRKHVIYDRYLANRILLFLFFNKYLILETNEMSTSATILGEYKQRWSFISSLFIKYNQYRKG